MTQAIKICIFALTCFVLFVGFRVTAPLVERWLYPPIHELVFNHFECVEGDVIAIGFLNKSEYPNGDSADFLGMNILGERVPARRLAWRSIDTSDSSPVSRPPGAQIVDIYISDGCGRKFTANTRHRSPLTGLIIPMTFGPFMAVDTP